LISLKSFALRFLLSSILQLPQLSSCCSDSIFSGSTSSYVVPKLSLVVGSIDLSNRLGWCILWHNASRKLIQ